MNGLDFSESGFIPAKTFKRHLKTIYGSSLDQMQTDLFTALIDKNNDENIEVDEIIYFFDHLYETEGTAEKYQVTEMLYRMAALIFEIGEPVDKFFETYNMFTDAAVVK
jgi:hypothetical protein